MTLGADFAPPGNQGEFIGVWRFISDIGTSAGPFMVAGVAGVATLGVACVATGGVGLAGAAVMAFLALYLLSGGFRRFVLAQDLETLTMLQHWRVLGFCFLPLYFYGVIPGVFAWPAGWLTGRPVTMLVCAGRVQVWV